MKIGDKTGLIHLFEKWFLHSKFYNEETVKKWTMSALMKCFLENNKILNELKIEIKPKNHLY